MKYLLDTCVISELVKQRPCTRVVEWLKQQDPDSLYLSFVTVGDIKNGIAKEPFTISGTGKQVRDVLHGEDIVNLYFKAKDVSEAYGQVFNIGGGIENSLSLLELFAMLEDRLNIKMFYNKLPWRESDQKVFVADIHKAKEIIGWWPKVTTQDGIEKM